MKHYLTYEADGEITGVCSFQQAATGLRGWPDEYEIDKPDTEHVASKDWLASAKRPPSGGYLRYDCPCPRTAPQCNCCTVMRLTKYLQGDQLIDKTTTVCKLNGDVLASGATISQPPATPILLRFEFDGALDGQVVSLMQSASPMILESVEPSVTLPIAAGVVEVTVYAPAQGLVGQLRVVGKTCTMSEVKIRGWGV